LPERADGHRSLTSAFTRAALSTCGRAKTKFLSVTRMKRPTILYSSSEIHTRIKSIFAHPNANDKRVALVAYVGQRGASFLPHPDGLRIVCSPTAGATHPDALRDLITRGAIVEFSDALHMKVYWSRQRGCILTSANASARALGIAGLKEVGIWLPPGMLDIDRLIKYAQPRKLTSRELRKLDHQTRRFSKLHGQSYYDKEPAREFLEWYKSPHRTPWKLNWSDERVGGTAKAAKEESRTEYGVRNPHYWLCCAKGRVKPDDCLLSFMLARDKVTEVRWHNVDIVVKISPKEKGFYEKNWPYHAVQVHPPSDYPSPPFRISSQFRSAFRRACVRYSFEKIKTATSDEPSLQLLKLIREEMGK